MDPLSGTPFEDHHRSQYCRHSRDDLHGLDPPHPGSLTRALRHDVMVDGIFVLDHRIAARLNPARRQREPVGPGETYRVRCISLAARELR